MFDDATLQIPFRHADATQFSAIVAAASRTLDELAPAVSIVDDARARLRARQGQKTSLATLARLLKVSERSLQRRLAEAGVTFRQLADEVRMSTLAEHASKRQKGRLTAEALGPPQARPAITVAEREREMRGRSMYRRHVRARHRVLVEIAGRT